MEHDGAPGQRLIPPSDPHSGVELRHLRYLPKLADVAHWPPIEAPERIANLVLTTAPVGDG